MGCNASSSSKVSAKIQTKDVYDNDGNAQASQDSTNEKYYLDLIDGVSLIAKPEDTNPIVCIDSNSFPVVVARLYLNDITPTNIYLPIVAAANCKSGRVVCLGSISYIRKDYLDTVETKHFLYNCIKWAVNKTSTSKPALLLNIPDRYVSDFQSFLGKHNIQAEVGDESAAFSKYDLIICTSSFSNSEEIEKYVNNGGALICFFNSSSENENDDMMAFSMNYALTKLGLGFTVCTLNVCRSNLNTIEINKNFFDIKDFVFQSVFDDYKEEISKHTISETILDDLVTNLRFYLAVLNCENDQNDKSLEKIKSIIKVTWEFLSNSKYSTPEGLCPKISQSICFILLSQLIYKIPQEYITAVPESDIFPGKVGDVALTNFRKDFELTSFEWLSTGLYLPPGKISTIKTSSTVDNVYFQIGCHNESLLSKQTPWKRWPNIIMSYPLNMNEIHVVSPYGGLCYMVIEKLSENASSVNSSRNVKNIRVEFLGFTESPRLDIDNPDVFEKTKDIPIPWSEIDMKIITFTLPTKHFLKIHDQKQICDKFTTLLKSIIKLTSYTLTRPYRVVFDIELAEDEPVCGYPLVFLIDDIDNILFSEKPTPQLMALLILLSIVSIRENTLDEVTETAIGQVVAATSANEIWPEFDPITIISNDEIFNKLWHIHLKFPLAISKTLELIQNPNYIVPDDPDEKWGLFARELSRMLQLDMGPFLSEARPLPETINTSELGLPVYKE